MRFCLEHRKDKIFKDWKPHHIAYVLAKAYHEGNLYIVRNANQITGMVIAYPILDKCLHIDQILCKDREAFRGLIELCAVNYPGYKLVYDRRGQRKTLNQAKLKGI